MDRSRRTATVAGTMAVATLLTACVATGCRTIVCDGGCVCDGHTCSCPDATACTVECLELDCDLACTGSGSCDFTVGAPASVACSGSGGCDVDCLDDCVVSCPGSGRCRVFCADGAQCSIINCSGATVNCNNQTVCGAPCTG